jgi:hypothetical protein
MKDEHYQKGRKLFKFTFELNPDRTPSQQMAQMKIAFERATSNFFAGKKPEVVDHANEPERY